MVYNILYIATIVLEFVTVPIFLKYYWPEKCKQSMLFKMISATLFIICGYCALKISNNNTPYATLMMWGFAFGWLGDLLLHWLSDKMAIFVLGVVSFLTGHVFFIVAFQKAIDTTYPGHNTFEWYELLFLALSVAAIVIFALVKKLFKEKAFLTSGLLVYGVVLLAMFAKAARYCIGEWAYGTNDHMVMTFVTVLGGATLFLISDALLGYIIIFKKHNRVLRIINIVTYFAAQILLASSLLIVRSAYPLYN
ncbi:MAG: lysoplasmalogenase [Clostridia bacterium]|nr:lysoplasmalogenase [Clostridia bacterium]